MKFSDFSISVKLDSEFDAGLCMISNTSGAVCLMRAGQEIQTYRLSVDDWEGVERTGSQREAISYIKGDDIYLQDTAFGGAVEWMDSFYCSTDEFGTYTCTAFQPAWQKDGIYDQGYPRFGIEESEMGEFTYTMLKNVNSKMETKLFLIDGAAALIASCAAAVLLLGF